MKLLEFFSVNNNENDEGLSKEQTEKDLMAYILDDDDIYKEKMLPLIHKLKKNESIDTLKDEFLDMVNGCCIAFYKEEDMTGDPNKIFPVKMRELIVKNLIQLHKNAMKKKKDKDAD